MRLPSFIVASVALSLICSSCHPAFQVFLENDLATINLIDQNGVSETVCNRDRLAQYATVDFLSPQPYRKVLRVYQRNCQGDIEACITSYYPNGQIDQYLELLNGRAFGIYRSWHENGQLKIEVEVIGGEGDLGVCSARTWLFNGVSRAWDSCGKLQAEIQYSKGNLEGDALYFHGNGSIWKKIPFTSDRVNGQEEIFCENGQLLQTAIYLNGIKNGPSTRYWQEGSLAAQECYKNGNLIEGRYWDLCGNEIGGIQEGNGFRASFSKKGISELQEFRGGQQEGRISLFNTAGELVRVYHIKSGEKHGEEIEFYPHSTQPQLSLQWVQGKLHGIARTFYRNGVPEGQREMADNRKNGLLTAWYSNGDLMLIEEYDHDKLLKGEYYKFGDHFPVSTIIGGRGIATFFDSEGIFLRKVNYRHGRPEL